MSDPLTTPLTWTTKPKSGRTNTAEFNGVKRIWIREPIGDEICRLVMEPKDGGPSFEVLVIPGDDTWIDL